MMDHQMFMNLATVWKDIMLSSPHSTLIESMKHQTMSVFVRPISHELRRVNWRTSCESTRLEIIQNNGLYPLFCEQVS